MSLYPFQLGVANICTAHFVDEAVEAQRSDRASWKTPRKWWGQSSKPGLPGPCLSGKASLLSPRQVARITAKCLFLAPGSFKLMSVYLLGTTKRAKVPHHLYIPIN